MFKINYNIIKRGYERWMDLRYHFLKGNATFISDNGVIDLEDIPILDLAVALHLISNELNRKEDSKQSFDFTESSEEILFTKFSNKLIITTTYSEEIIETTYTEFKKAVEIFYRKLTQTIPVEYPELKTNKIYLDILKLTDKDVLVEETSKSKAWWKFW